MMMIKLIGAAIAAALLGVAAVGMIMLLPGFFMVMFTIYLAAEFINMVSTADEASKRCDEVNKKIIDITERFDKEVKDGDPPIK